MEHLVNALRYAEKEQTMVFWTVMMGTPKTMMDVRQPAKWNLGTYARVGRWMVLTFANGSALIFRLSKCYLHNN